MPGSTINTGDYRIGGAELYFSATIADTKMLTASAAGFCNNSHSLGNIVDAGITPDITYVDHHVSSKGKRVKDKVVANTVSLAISFTFDEMNQSNLAKFFLANTVASDLRVMENTLDEGSAVLRVNTSIGNSLVYKIPKCIVRPDGELALNTEDWHSAPMVLEILEYLSADNSNATINASWLVAPFGLVDTNETLA